MMKSVLVIEDDRFLSAMIQRELTAEGYTAFQAFNGEEGLRWLKSNTADAIILDIILPTMNGFDVLQALSLDPNLARIPVLVVSNLALDSDIERAKQLGVVDYFVKVKVTPGEIVNRIRMIIG